MARGRLFVWLGSIIGLAVGVAAPAAAATLPAPGGFRLSASNGYSIHAIAFDGEELGEHDEVIVFVGRKARGAAAYFVEKGVVVTESTVFAPLGKLGLIDLRFVPSGRVRREASACDRQLFKFDSGFYEGRFDFRGEEGYTQAHRVRARGEIRIQASLLCSESINEGFGGHSPGARLQVRRRWPKGSLLLEVKKNSPIRPAYFEAWIEERSQAMAVTRAVTATGAAPAFEFDVPAQAARLAPPQPFAGIARFDRSGKEQGRLWGNLTVDFPGRSDVSLTGARGSLSRYVNNPSHPFRLLLSRPVEGLMSR
jgi:hypothetical protein